MENEIEYFCPTCNLPIDVLQVKPHVSGFRHDVRIPRTCSACPEKYLTHVIHTRIKGEPPT